LVEGLFPTGRRAGRITLLREAAKGTPGVSGKAQQNPRLGDLLLRTALHPATADAEACAVNGDKYHLLFVN